MNQVSALNVHKIKMSPDDGAGGKVGGSMSRTRTHEQEVGGAGDRNRRCCDWRTSPLYSCSPIAKVNAIDPLRTGSVCAIFHGNPSACEMFQ